MIKDTSFIFFIYYLVLSTFLSGQELSISQRSSLKGHQADMLHTTHGLALRFNNEPSQQKYDWLIDNSKGEQLNIVIQYPDNSDYLFFMANLYLEKNSYMKAIELYKKVEILDPLYHGMNEALSFSYYGLKNYDEAISYHHKVVEDYGESRAYEKAYYYRHRLSLSYLIAGDSYLAKGEPRLAFNSYKMAYNSNQLSVLAQVRLAMSYLSLYHNDDKALELISKALSLEQSEAIRVAYRNILEAVNNL